MSRLNILVSQPRLALGALLTLLLAAGAVVGSGADFTATSANPANTFASGTLSIENSKEGVAILSASDLRPGDPATHGTVEIENAGSLAGRFTLSRATPVDSDGDNPMSSKLNTTVVDCGHPVGGAPPVCGDADDVTLYAGTLAEMGTTGHEIAPLGSFTAGHTHLYRFGVALDGSAGNAYQGDSSTVRFDFNAA